MPFEKEPPFTHGQVPRTAVLLCNLGTPDAPTPKAVRRYLSEFLGGCGNSLQDGAGFYEFTEADLAICQC